MHFTVNGISIYWDGATTVIQKYDMVTGNLSDKTLKQVHKKFP